ncbi:hypothetical protein A2Z23_00635 [Candidatus Curtissbacteria bacterium RBG_16_39_7]|uniref:Glycosyl transferase family 1 domain-containing protein n=1 Tax=Candidatus Curtissbacteria bacterium RBG_16_39_7 TaxID=1797707 RepID=A0A1F5G3L0_9BACT|nr:MAG: hypothetical protein A2Z23_00635 [Candidatus Curtissbacteria bacterium RBG_16_39_7]
MRILIFNWRDIKNPNFGGAEIATHEIAKRLVAWGHEVTLFSSRFHSGKEEESVDGVKVLRAGSPFTVHLAAFWNYQKKFKGNFDLVIDQIHGLPFFTPLYVKEPKIAYIHEVAKNIWFWEWPLPVALAGFLGDFLLFRLFYRNTNFITGSNSTLNDLQSVGIPKKNIKIVRYGVPKKTVSQSYRKEKYPAVIFVGRIYRAKRIEEILKAAKLLIKKYPKLQLWIVGKGKKKYEENLKKLVNRLKIDPCTKFYGFLDEKKKFELISKAWVICATSVKEGWGLTIVEAASVGTPAVVYNVGGLKEVVINNKTGIICQKNTPESLAQNILKLISDQKLRSKLEENATIFASSFSWEKTAKEFASVINQVVKAS